MAKKVIKSAKPVAKKATTKKTNVKPAAKKAASKPAAKKLVAKALPKKAAPKNNKLKDVNAKDVNKKAIAKMGKAKPTPKKAAVSKKSASKPAPKKTIAKKPATKTATKKVVTKPVANKVAAKKVTAKPAAKKAAPKKTTVKPVAKKVAANKIAAKPAAKKAVAKKSTTAKPVAKKVVTKKAAPKAAIKKTVVKPVAKKATAKKGTEKSSTKKTALRVPPSVRGVVIDKKLLSKDKKQASVNPKEKPQAKKKLEKKIVNEKPTSAKLNLTLKEDKTAKLALRRKKIMEIKNNYETPRNAEDDDYGDVRLPIIGRTRFSDAELNEFKTLINKKLEEAREELNFYQDQMKESEMNDDDIKFSGMEDGGHTNDKEHLSAMANRQIKFIQGLEAALVRIENKTYGICRMTGNLIDKKRLMAVPHATLSMEAKVGAKKR